MATHIVAIAWAAMQADKELFCKAFLNCGISIYSDGREDHLISIKGVDNTVIDPNGWFGYLQVGNALNEHAIVPDDDDLITALVSAAEGVTIKLVIRKQLQAEYLRRGIPKSGTKPELLARLQAHEAQQLTGGGQGIGEDDEFAVVSPYIELGTPLRSSSFSSPSSSPKNEV
jgi:hypothetical protein